MTCTATRSIVRRRLLSTLTACLFTACSREDPAGVTPQHRGFRDDVADEQRGNGVFDSVWWSADGAYFVTRHRTGSGLNVWDARDGRLVTTIDATTIDGEVFVDGVNARLVARARGSRPQGDLTRLVVYDLLEGTELASIPDDGKNPSAPIGWTDGGSALVISRPERIEVWRTHPAELLRASEGPLSAEAYRPGDALLVATAIEKRTAEISPSGRRLALTHAESGRRRVRRHDLVDLTTMQHEPLEPPTDRASSGFSSFAFSPDDRVLALGTDAGVWMYDVVTREWGPFVPGDHKRNAFLAPMGFSADGSRFVALGDQLQVSVFQASNGALLGRYEPPFDDWEGVFRMSRDGSRVVLYHFVSDTLEVLDARDASRIGWVCPYFCNKRHNPVAVPYAISPDGKSLVASHRYGAALWDVDHDRLIAPLVHPSMPPVKER